MDYDKTDIAHHYNRGRDHGPEIRNLWMDAVSSHLNGLQIKTILDLGCGTGRFTEDLAARFNAEVIGIDPSTKMLEQAKRKHRDPRVRYELGRAEALPIADDSIDLVFISMVFHHFDDPTLAARECRRVLGESGTVFMRAGTCERISIYPYVKYFLQSRPILDETLVSGAGIQRVFEAAGFKTVGIDLVTQQIAPNLVAYAEKLAAGADSVLARLEPADFEAGMNALRLDASGNNSQPVCEPIDVFVFRSFGSKPQV